MRTYRSQIERTIRPALGKVVLTRLTAKNLDALYGAMKDAGKGSSMPSSGHFLASTRFVST